MEFFDLEEFQNVYNIYKIKKKNCLNNNSLFYKYKNINFKFKVFF